MEIVVRSAVGKLGGLGEWPGRVQRGNLALDATPLLMGYENCFSFISPKMVD